jgi:serine/threonine protein kinase/tetratricopeptide (TPR) repeat protein
MPTCLEKPIGVAMPRNYAPGDSPVPGYKLKRFLGRGGFGEVWKASAPGHLEVAIKIINLRGKPGQKELRALQLVKRLRHPNLNPVTAFWLKDETGAILPDPDESMQAPSTPLRGTMLPTDDPTSMTGGEPTELIICMGLADESLFNRLEACQKEGLGGIPVEELLDYIGHAASAIDYLNSPRHTLHGGKPVAVQHCDIKPHNILIVGGAAQVCDFGLARVAEDVHKSHNAAATIAYAAPEFLAAGKPSSSTDQYSLAVTYHELRTGELPYDGDDYHKVMLAVQHGKLNLSRLPAGERAVIAKALSLSPADRYATATEMAGALRMASLGAPPAALDPASVADTRDITPGSEPAGAGFLMGFVASAAVLAALGLGLAGWWWWPQISSLAAVTNPTPPKIEPEKKGDPVAKKAAVEPPTKTVVTPEKKEPEKKEPEKKEPEKKEPEKKEPEKKTPEKKEPDPKGTETKQPEKKQPEKKQPEKKQPEKAPPTPLEQARAARAAGKWDTALARYNEWLAMHPEDATAIFERGEARRHLDLLDEAISDFEAARQLAPAQYTVSPAISAAYAARGETRIRTAPQAALADAERAISANDKSALGYLVRGTAHIELRQFEQAEKDLTVAIEFDPRDAKAWSRRGVVRLERNRYADSITDFTKALEIDEKPHPFDLRKRGQARLLLKQLEPAYSDLTAAAKLEPNDALGQFLLGDALRQKDSPEAALACYEKAMLLDREFAQPHVSSALILHMQGKHREALPFYRRAIDLNYSDLELVYDRRADAYMALNERELAAIDRDIARRFMEVSASPQDVAAHCQLAMKLATAPQAEVRAGRKARELAETACKQTDYKQLEPLEALAAAEAELGHYDVAIRWGEKALELATEDAAKTRATERLATYRKKEPLRMP